jgi:SAM-dependent methyltransferase
VEAYGAAIGFGSRLAIAEGAVCLELDTRLIVNQPSSRVRVGQHLIDAVGDVASQYPERLRSSQLRDVGRIAFHLALAIQEHDPTASTICDIGGGLGLFAQSCGAIGFQQIFMVDDLGDQAHREAGTTIDPLFQKYRVSVISRDVILSGVRPAIPEASVDIFTCFESMEHWHHSPKKLFSQLMECLKPGGVFVLGVPNCVNLRKRLTVPFGRGKWSAMTDWYEQPFFRGHVREPDVGDLHYIAADMQLTNTLILGRNWLGHTARSRFIRLGTKFIDLPLRVFPSLCSDIYLVGRKSKPKLIVSKEL